MAIKFLSGQTITGNITLSGDITAATFNSLAINSTGTNNVANQIVRTEANGYANFGWINSVSGNHTGSITRITASDDAYLRYVTPAQFRTGVTDGYYASAGTVDGVTSVATGNGLSGGTITGTGTLTMSGSYTGSFTVTGGLNVSGSNHFVTFENTSTTANHYAQILLKAGDRQNYIWTANQNSTNWGGAGSLNIYTNDSGSSIAFFTEGDATNTKLMIRADGNIGIGTNSPSAKLEVKAADTGSTTDYATKVIKAVAPLVGGYTGTKIISLLGGFDNAIHAVDFGYGYNTTGYDMILSTNDNTSGNPIERMRIDSSGNVGIGKSPQSDARLHTYRNSTDAYNIFESSANKWVFGEAAGVCQVGGRYGYHSGILIDTSGNAGIGVTPFAHTLGTSASLDLKGNGGIWGYAGATYVNSNAYYNSGWKYKTTAPAAVLQVGGSSQELTFRQAVSGTAGNAITYTQPFTIDTSGNVGIGTTNPSGKLEVNGNNYNTNSLTTFTLRDLGNNYGDGDNSIDIVMRSRYWSGDANTSQNSKIRHLKDNGNGSTGTMLQFGTTTEGSGDASTKMTIKANGNVGIGITAPVPKLHLAYSGGSYGTDATSGFINQADTGRATQRIRSITDNAAELFFDVNGGIRWDISARGSASSHALHFYPQAPTPVYNNVAAHTFQLSQNGDVIVTGAGSSGRLGIGTTSPSAALDVAGASAVNIGAAIIRENSTLAYTATSFNARPTITMYGVNTTNTYVGTRLSNAGNTEFFQGIVKGANNGEITYVWQGYNGTAYQQFGAIDCYGTGAGSLVMSGDVVAYSDKKLKKNIKTLDGSKVYKMRGVSFDRIDTGKSSSGVIAQEMQEIAPELVNESDGTLGVAYGNLTGYLIEAIKEQQKQIDDLQDKIKKLTNL